MKRQNVITLALVLAMSLLYLSCSEKVNDVTSPSVNDNPSLTNLEKNNIYSGKISTIKDLTDDDQFMQMMREKLGVKFKSRIIPENIKMIPIDKFPPGIHFPTIKEMRKISPKKGIYLYEDSIKFSTGNNNSGFYAGNKGSKNIANVMIPDTIICSWYSLVHPVSNSYGTYEYCESGSLSNWPISGIAVLMHIYINSIETPYSPYGRLDANVSSAIVLATFSYSQQTTYEVKSKHIFFNEVTFGRSGPFGFAKYSYAVDLGEAPSND